MESSKRKISLFEIKTNKYLRFVLYPLIILYRRIEYMVYQQSNDSKRLKQMKDMYLGGKCIIVGNGPSLAASDLDLIGDKIITIGTNRIYDIYRDTKWRPTIYMLMDRTCIRNISREKNSVPECKMAVVGDYIASRKWKKRNKNVYWAMTDWHRDVNLQNMVMDSFSKEVYKYFSNSNSTTLNEIELAIFLGFKEIYLIGMDHTFPIEIDMNGRITKNNGVVHHFSQSNYKNTTYANKEALTNSYYNIKTFAKSLGVDIYNVTRGGELDVFPRTCLEKVL